VIRTRFTTTNLYLLGFCLVLLLAWCSYRPALSGAFQLDDIGNLGGLARIEDTASAMDFVISGAAGPLGRPLALLTFALQAESWEQGAAAFLTVNVLIHLLNALLLAWCLYWMALQSGVEREKSTLVAAVAAGVWVMLPLLATASLLVVQRMTTLSALCMLLGLGGYLLARRQIDVKPTRALFGMSVSLAAGTLLAALAKESGLLLPVFVLVLEATILDRPTGIAMRRWRLWQSLFLLLPLLAIVAFLASRSAYPDSMVARRDFDAWERLLSEAHILWVYLRKALLGIPAELGIYQNPPQISRSLFDPLTLLACISWLALAALSVVWRRRYPLLALAVLWYLGGHLIESSVIPLELYFEHRNYLPIVGPVFALCSFLLLGPTKRRRVGMVVLPVFVLVSAYFLYTFASLWGEPSRSSRYWAMQYPQSVRAVSTMATYQLEEEGPRRTLQTIDQFVIAYPQYAYLRIQELNLRCMIAPDQDHGLVLAELERELPDVDFTYTAGTMLSQLFDTVASGQCNGVGADTVKSLANVLYSNRRYASDSSYGQFHFKLLAAISRRQGEYAESLENLRVAISHRPSSELNMMMVTALGGAGDFSAAHAFIDSAEKKGPGNLLRAVAWQRDLDGLRAYIHELERYSAGEQETE
jgi:hypothetical protein